MLDDALMYGAGGFIVRAALALLIVYCLVTVTAGVMKWFKAKGEVQEGQKPPAFPFVKIALWIVVALAAFGGWTQTFSYLPRSSLNVPTVQPEIKQRDKVQDEAPVVIEQPAQNYTPKVPTSEEVEEAVEEDVKSVIDAFRNLPDADK